MSSLHAWGRRGYLEGGVRAASCHRRGYKVLASRQLAVMAEAAGDGLKRQARALMGQGCCQLCQAAAAGAAAAVAACCAGGELTLLCERQERLQPQRDESTTC